MKHATVVLAIIVATFIAGCQDNNITDPTGNTLTNNSRLSRIAPGNNILPIRTLSLNAVLRDPGSAFNSFVEIRGQVTYTAVKVKLDPILVTPRIAMRLNLTTNAELRPYELKKPIWRAFGSSDDQVAIPDSGVSLVEKRYDVEGRTDGMILHLRIRVTVTSVELNAMWLELPRVED